MLDLYVKAALSRMSRLWKKTEYKLGRKSYGKIQEEIWDGLITNLYIASMKFSKFLKDIDLEKIIFWMESKLNCMFISYIYQNIKDFKDMN